jgi:hypothetical protein
MRVAGGGLRGRKAVGINLYYSKPHEMHSIKESILLGLYKYILSTTTDNTLRTFL